MDINLHQFRRNVRSMNIDADNESIDALFVSVDQDGGGSLDVSEIRQALEHWKQATAQADQRSVKLQKISSGMWKAAKLKQMDLKQRFNDIEEAERRKLRRPPNWSRTRRMPRKPLRSGSGRGSRQ